MTINKFFIPTEQEIKAVKTGELAPDYMGRLMEVTEVTATRQDINGKWFVCYYVKHGDNGSIVSHSLTEGKLNRSLPLCNEYTSYQLDQIEAKMLNEIENKPF
jgi:hypothetical protein